MEVILRYSAAKLDSLAYDENAGEQIKFDPVKNTGWTVETSETSGTMLGGRKYSHSLYAHKTITLVIASDELSESSLSFIEEFWKSNYKYVSTMNPNGTFADYVRVIGSAGKLPLSYVDEIIDYPEVTLELTSAEAV